MIVLARGISTRRENAAVAALVLAFALGGGVVAVAAEIATAGLMAAIGASTTALRLLSSEASILLLPAAGPRVACSTAVLSSLAVSPERSHRRPTALRAGQLLFHLQHTFEESYKSRPPYYCAYTNAMRGCSYIPAPVSGPNRGLAVDCFRLGRVFGSVERLKGCACWWPQEVLKFFLAGIEYHHIHHLNTRVP